MQQLILCRLWETQSCELVSLVRVYWLLVWGLRGEVRCSPATANISLLRAPRFSVWLLSKHKFNIWHLCNAFLIENYWPNLRPNYFFTELLSKLKLSIFASEWRSKYLSFWMYWSEAVYSCSLASVIKMWTTNIFKWGASHNEVAVFFKSVIIFEFFNFMQHRWYSFMCAFKPFSKVLLMVKSNFLGCFSAGWSLTAEGPLALKVYVFWRAQPRTPASVMARSS